MTNAGHDSRLGERREVESALNEDLLGVMVAQE